MCKNLSKIFIALAFIGLSATARAQSVADIVSTIAAYGSGGGTGTLAAAVSGDTVTVTGALTGVNQQLTLDIPTGVKVKWLADMSGDFTDNWRASAISLNPNNGIFEFAGGTLSTRNNVYGAIRQVSGSGIILCSGGNLNTSLSYCIYGNYGTGTVIITGGTLSTTNLALIYGANTVVLAGGTLDGSGLFEGRMGEIQNFYIVGGTVVNEGKFIVMNDFGYTGVIGVLTTFIQPIRAFALDRVSRPNATTAVLLPVSAATLTITGVNGVPATASYAIDGSTVTFGGTMNANVTLNAVLTVSGYTFNYTTNAFNVNITGEPSAATRITKAAGDGGTITSAGLAYTAAPDEYHIIDKVFIDGAAATVSNPTVPYTHTFADDGAAHIIFATFKPDPLAHYLNINVSGGGTLAVTRGGAGLANGAPVADGETLTLTAAPNAGNALQRLTVNGEDKTSEYSGGYAFTVTARGADIAAAFIRPALQVTNNNDDGAGSLRQAINNAAGGETIDLSAITGQTITLESLIIINKSITIKGCGVIISGNGGGVSLVRVDNPAAVTIERIHFKGITGIENGVASVYSATLNVESCIFSETQSDGSIAGLYAYNSQINVRGCTFYNNSAAQGIASLITSSHANNQITLTGNVFYGTARIVLRNNGTVTSGGYNVWDNSSYGFTFDNASDAQITAPTFNTTDFSPTGAELNIIAAAPAAFPATDFNGAERMYPNGTAGAVHAADAGNIPVTVSGVSVSPASASVETGKTQPFTAVVEGANNPPQTVTWSAAGALGDTHISAGGVLRIGANETAATITVRAASEFDNTKYGEAVVTVTQPPVSGTTTVTKSAGYGGTVTNTGLACTVTPNANYVIDEVFIDGVSQTVSNRAGATFNIPDDGDKHSIFATFAYTVNF